jgi:hypothetical protein
MNADVIGPLYSICDVVESEPVLGLGRRHKAQVYIKPKTKPKERKQSKV